MAIKTAFIKTGTLDPMQQEKVSPVTELVTEAALDKRIEELKKTLEQFARPIGVLIVGIIVVLFIGFVATLVAMLALIDESNNFKMNAYQQLSSEVQSLLQKTK
jgi:hypothetical protein